MKKLNLMNRVKLTRVIACLACLFFLAGVGNATPILYDNLSSQSAGVDPVAGWTYNETVYMPPLFDSFSVGPVGPEGTTLLEVQLLLKSGGSSSGAFSVALYSDSGNTIPSPGTVLDPIGTMEDSSLTSDLSVVDFFTAYHSVADTRYWIGLSPIGSSTAEWSWSLDQDALGVDGEYFGQDDVILSNVYGPYQMCVITPIPGAVWLLGSGLAALGLWRRRKFFKA